jgi:hypothetical protein
MADLQFEKMGACFVTGKSQGVELVRPWLFSRGATSGLDPRSGDNQQREMCISHADSVLGTPQSACHLRS